MTVLSVARGVLKGNIVSEPQGHPYLVTGYDFRAGGKIRIQGTLACNHTAEPSKLNKIFDRQEKLSYWRKDDLLSHNNNPYWNLPVEEQARFEAEITTAP